MAAPLKQQCTECGFVYDPKEYGGIALIEREEWECPGVEGMTCDAGVGSYELIEPESELDDEETEEDEELDARAEVPATERSRKLKS